MTPTDGYISADTTMFLVGQTSFTEITATFEYRATDPYAVSVTFQNPSGPATWLIGRELLRAGLTHPTGLGDVRIWPAHSVGVFYIHLNAPSGEALLEGSRPSAMSFLFAADLLVPPDTEEVLSGLDDEIRELLGDDR